MVRFPYELEVWHEADATQNPDGSYTEGVKSWVKAGKCNVTQNGAGNEVTLADGSVFVYAYEVSRPPRSSRIADNTKVRIVRNGVNWFDGKPVEESTITYAVRGSNPFKQRNAKSILWL